VRLSNASAVGRLRLARQLLAEAIFTQAARRSAPSPMAWGSVGGLKVINFEIVFVCVYPTLPRWQTPAGTPAF